MVALSSHCHDDTARSWVCVDFLFGSSPGFAACLRSCRLMPLTPRDVSSGKVRMLGCRILYSAQAQTKLVICGTKPRDREGRARLWSVNGKAVELAVLRSEHPSGLGKIRVLRCSPVSASGSQGWQRQARHPRHEKGSNLSRVHPAMPCLPIPSCLVGQYDRILAVPALE